MWGGVGGGGGRLRPALWAGRDADEPIKKEKEIKVLGGSFCLEIWENGHNTTAQQCGSESLWNLSRRLQQIQIRIYFLNKFGFLLFTI